ncbi:unnamed protein product [Symbiodinium sp. CCMP2592]|nr:unnamed protein product [Symbiodinium sp. CCMP2592]
MMIDGVARRRFFYGTSPPSVIVRRSPDSSAAWAYTGTMWTSLYIRTVNAVATRVFGFVAMTPWTSLWPRYICSFCPGSTSPPRCIANQCGHHRKRTWTIATCSMTPSIALLMKV